MILVCSWMDRVCGLTYVGTGIILATFHDFGILQVNNDRMKSFASGEAILLAVMKADMPSGPLALLISSLVMKFTC